MATHAYDRTCDMVVTADRKREWRAFLKNPASQLTRLLNQGPGATPVTLADFAYTYDAVGNRATRIALPGIASDTYDALHRLTQASQPDPIDPLR